MIGVLWLRFFWLVLIICVVVKLFIFGIWMFIRMRLNFWVFVIFMVFWLLLVKLKFVFYRWKIWWMSFWFIRLFFIIKICKLCICFFSCELWLFVFRCFLLVFDLLLLNGILKMKWEFFFGLFFVWMVLFCNFINFLIIVRFNLVLLYLCVIWILVCLKFLKIMFNLLVLILILVLWIINCSKYLCCLCFSKLVFILMILVLVNLLVLLSKLDKIWLRWVGFLRSKFLIFVLILILILIGFLCILNWKVCFSFCNIFCKLKGCFLNFSLFVLIFDILRILLIIFIKLFVENCSVCRYFFWEGFGFDL